LTKTWSCWPQNSFGGIKKNDDLISKFNHQRFGIDHPKMDLNQPKMYLTAKRRVNQQ
jgi:hypothetical protein